MFVQEVAIKDPAHHVNQIWIRLVVVECKQEKFNVGNWKNNNLNVKQYAKGKEAVANIYAIKFVANSELLQSHKIIIVSLPVINWLIVENINVDNHVI